MFDYTIIFETGVEVSPLDRSIVDTLLHTLHAPKEAIPLVSQTVTTRMKVSNANALPTEENLSELCREYNTILKEKMSTATKYIVVNQTAFAGYERVLERN